MQETARHRGRGLKFQKFSECMHENINKSEIKTKYTVDAGLPQKTQSADLLQLQKSVSCESSTETSRTYMAASLGSDFFWPAGEAMVANASSLQRESAKWDPHLRTTSCFSRTMI